MTNESRSGVPEHYCWIKQVLVPVDLLLVFLGEVSGNLFRRLSFASYLQRGPKVALTTDASPYGIGAVLETDGHLTGSFSNKPCD